MFLSGIHNMVSRPFLGWRYFLRVQSKSLQFSSIAAPPAVPKQEDVVKNAPQSALKRSSSMVDAAFRALSEPQDTPTGMSRNFASLDEQIAASKTVPELLKIADNAHVSKNHALRIVSVLAEWASEKKIKISDFESDQRFHKLCRLLGKTFKSGTSSVNQKLEVERSQDLATVLEVTGDDEAAKMVGTCSFEQMIKVFRALALKKRRSTPLLRALAFHICRASTALNVKQSADLLFSMASLNFPDENMLDKIRSDLSESLPTNEKPAPVGSILTSLGLLRHKDAALLEIISTWVSQHLEVCRPQDLVSLLLTLAHVGYLPNDGEALVKRISDRLTGPHEVPNLSAWLEVVWSLAVLGHVSTKQVTSVLEPSFRTSLESTSSLTVATKLKLLNISAVAQLELPKYKGPLLESSQLNAPLQRSQNKEVLVKSVLDSLANLLPSQTYLKPTADSGMGFLIDGECMLDSKGNPLPISSGPEAGKTAESATETSSSKAAKEKKGTRIAILVWDYPDLCRGSLEPTGPNALAVRLLQQQGLKVCSVPYTEFNPKEKLVKRVQYLEQNLKALATTSKRPAR